jgi:hypothetical protein
MGSVVQSSRVLVQMLATNFRKCSRLLGSFLVVILVNLLWIPVADAASVYNCSRSGRKCVAKVEDGIVGDRVKVLDEKARVVASGRIVKRKGTYAIISIVAKTKHIRKGYPVIVQVENRGSNFQWAASFSK